jgi:flagellar basal body P-ring protein FlgI
MPFQRTVWGFAVTILGMAASGCSAPVIRSQTPDGKTLALDEKEVRLVRDMARPYGLRPMAIEGVGLTSQLDNTGSDPPASPHRELLLGDMQRRGAASPNAILASPTTSLVLVRALLPAGVRRGDRLDLEVMTPARSETTSLRNGWLMQVRLQEMAVLGNQLRLGTLMGLGEGSVIVTSLLESESDARSETRGRVLGGAVSMVDRSLALVMKTKHHSVRASSMVGSAVNSRFHTYDRGTKRGVATPMRDNYVELAIHSRYRNNLVRYVRVVQAIAVRESPQQLMDRLATLETQLLDPQTTKSAAVDLEAIGPEALPALRKGLAGSSPLVRFAAAEALAYMNEEQAVPELVQAARTEPAFRWHALTALSSMTTSDARDGLAELLHERSDETRYGAFQAMVDFNPRDPAVRGELLGDAMTLHHVPSDTEPLIHIRRTLRPEIVVFGQNVSLQAPAVVFAGKRILVKSEGKDRLKVSYFMLGQDDRTEYCANELCALVRTLIQVGGSYADVVAAMTDAKQKGLLTARVKFDALPQPGREYDLQDEAEELPEGFEPEIEDDDPQLPEPTDLATQVSQ